MKIESKCLHEGYKPGNAQPLTLPIYQSTTYKYDSSQFLGELFDLKVEGHMYSRISNPTVNLVEEKIAALEGGVGCVMTSSGQAALFLSIATIASAGDHIISSSSIYGGSMNLLNVTMRKLGIDVSFVDPEDYEALSKAVRPNTKAVFTESLSNPALVVSDIEKIAEIAHSHGIPLIVDNTFLTPVLCRPIEYGADIVVHSTTKYLDGHALQIGGAVVDSGKFNWPEDRFEGLNVPDESYHGVIYTKDFGSAAYITKLRVQMVRDLGCLQTAYGAFLVNLGMETLALRMEKHSSNALKVAEYLKNHDMVVNISYPYLAGDRYKELAMKYFPSGASGVISFEIKGGRKPAVVFMDSLEMISIATHVADVRSLVLHPGSTTHRQLSDEMLETMGISPGTIRLSIGIEHVDDIIGDIEQALKKASLALEQ